MSHIKFSDRELKALLNDERSCVKLQKGIKHISLHPFYLNNVAAGISENLDKTLSKYDKSLNGIILAYKKPRLPQSSGIVHNDKGSIFVDVEAEFYIFCPHENSFVKAIVNKTGKDHIGCLIHKAFNVSVPKPQNETHWKGKYVQTGDEILIKINYVDMFYIIPYIKGEIVDILTKSIKSEIDYDSGISTNEQHSKTTKKKLKTNKNNTSANNNNILEDITVINSLSVQIPEKELSKKSRKSKINSLIKEKDAHISENTNIDSKVDINTKHSSDAKNKSTRQKNTIHEIVPSNISVLENTNVSNNNKKNKLKINLEVDLSPMKIKKEKNDSFEESNNLTQELVRKIKKEIKSPTPDKDKSYDSATEKKDKNTKTIKSGSRNEIFKDSDAHVVNDTKSKILNIMDGIKPSKKIKNRRQTVSELLPTDNNKKKEHKKHEKLNRSLDDSDMPKLKKSGISSINHNSHKSKKTKKGESPNKIEDDIQTIQNKLIQSLLKEHSPKKRDSSLQLNQINNKTNETSSKKSKKNDSIKMETNENKTESQNETLDEIENDSKKRKSKRKKLNSPNEKYPSLQLNTPHYVDYIPTNEVSTFHDSISPIKMKDRPNLTSPETKKFTSPVASEHNTTKPKKTKRRSSTSLSDFQSQLLSKYLKK